MKTKIKIMCRVDLESGTRGGTIYIPLSGYCKSWKAGKDFIERIKEFFSGNTDWTKAKEVSNGNDI